MPRPALSQGSVVSDPNPNPALTSPHQAVEDAEPKLKLGSCTLVTSARRCNGGGAATRRAAVSDGTGKRALANELLTLAGPRCEGLIGACRPDLCASVIYVYERLGGL